MSELDDVDIKVEAYIYPTEDIEKVKSAISNIFADLNCRIEDLNNEVKIVRGSAHDIGALKRFRDLIKQEKIRNATRAIILGSLSNESVIFYLNKQVAYANHVSFSMPEAESPLDPIKVRIKSKKLISLIDWLAPSAKRI